MPSTTRAGTSRFSTSVCILHLCKILRHNSLWFSILTLRSINDPWFSLFLHALKSNILIWYWNIHLMLPALFLSCSLAHLHKPHMHRHTAHYCLVHRCKFLATCVLETRGAFSIASPLELSTLVYWNLTSRICWLASVHIDPGLGMCILYWGSGQWCALAVLCMRTSPSWEPALRSMYAHSLTLGKKWGEKWIPSRCECLVRESVLNNMYARKFYICKICFTIGTHNTCSTYCLVAETLCTQKVSYVC